MKKVCVIFGGASGEHEVSLRSATCILNNIDHKKYEVIMVGITKAGRWYHYTGPVELIATGQWEATAYIEPALLSPDAGEGGLILLGERVTASVKVRRRLFSDLVEKDEEIDSNGLRVLPIDVVFPVLHGPNGEDGTIQGLLELAGIPYVGCGLTASTNCMDKEIAHILLTHAGVPKTRLVAVRETDEPYQNFEKLAQQLETQLEYPMFVKPARAGSSLGVTKVSGRHNLKKAFETAFEHDTKVVVERAVTGREVECAVWGNEPHASKALGEIIPAGDLYDYSSKYQNDTASLVVPAVLPEDTVQNVRELAAKAYRAMDCTGLSRVDFFVQPDGVVVLNEINTMPGFTSISMFPRLFEEDGVSIAELVDHLINEAFAR